MSRGQRLLIGLLILLVATFLRLWAFGDVPPGLQHDEIFKAEDALRLIQYGDFRLFYPSNQGHEGAFVWMLGLSYLLVGINPLMIKFPAFVFGILTVALIFRFGWRAYAPIVGIVASSMTAVSFWAVFTSRVGLRAVMLPCVVLLVLMGLYRLFEARFSRDRWRSVIFTGAILGFAIYTYTSALALPIAFVGFVLFIVMFRRDLWQLYWRDLLIIGSIATMVILPMVYIRMNDPEGMNRADSITDPLQEAQLGNFQPVMSNALKLAGMPTFVGDPSWRYNVSGRPLFLLPIGLLVYIGFALAFLKSRKYPLNIMLIGITLIGLVPSLLTVLAPSFLRSIVTLPSMMLFIGIAVWQVENWNRRLGWGLAIVIIAITAIVDFHAYFVDWVKSQNPILTYHEEQEQGAGVYEIYLDDLEQLADYLSSIDESVVFVSTANLDLDPLVYKFSDAPANVHVVFFNAFANIVLSDQPSLLFVSVLSPISEAHKQWLTPEYGTEKVGQVLRQNGAVAYDIYRLSGIEDFITPYLAQMNEREIKLDSGGDWLPIDYPANFGDLLSLRAVEIPRETVFGEQDGVNNQLYFQPLVSSSSEPLRVFMHLIDAEGKIVAQRDLLDVPPYVWIKDMIFIQDNFVPFWDRVPAGDYSLVMGLYNTQSEARIPILDADKNPLGERILLGTIQVQDRQ